MKIVCDNKIPYLRGFAELLGEVVYLPGAEITAADVRDADALIVRTRTRCDRALLEGSRVRFVATATIGYDHIDTAFLREKGIAWTNCPGCNAESVAQYVECALLQLVWHGKLNIAGAGEGSIGPVSNTIDEVAGTTSAVSNAIAAAPSAPIPPETFQDLTIGIVGVGHVGRAVEARVRRMGFRHVLRCDPPRAEREGGGDFVSLETIAREADIVTLHTPLTFAPTPHATYHMAGAAFFARMKPTAVFINASRGETTDTHALNDALSAGRLRAAVIDTWENEPHIDRTLLERAFIATPHIAGYSADGKANGTRMALTAVARFFGLDEAPFAAVQAPILPEGYVGYREQAAMVPDARLWLYDPLLDSAALKAHPELFEKLRGDYPLRREHA